MATNNNTYPVNSRRLTRADIMPLYGSFGNESEGIAYAANVSTGIDTRFIVANQGDVSLFVPNDTNNKWSDYPRTEDESTGFRYTDWNYLTSSDLYIYTQNNNQSDNLFFILFPELNISGSGITLRGKNNWDANIIKHKDTINTTIDGINTNFNFESIRNIITTSIQNNLLPVLDIYKDSRDGFIDDVSVKLYKIYIDYTENNSSLTVFKNNVKNYMDKLFDALQDDYYTPINASMLKPKYIFDSDILPDGDFSYTAGVYEYRKFYSYNYNNWYWQHSLYWWQRPWSSLWWRTDWYNYWWCYYWYWNSWWYYYNTLYNYYNNLYSTSSTNVGETIRMCNVYKYNTYYPKEFIPMDAKSYYEQYKANSTTEANVKDYLKYLTNTYKANIYKINSYIQGVNKMVDKLLVVCEYAIYDYNKELATGHGVNYNIIYDAFPTVGLTATNKAKNYITFNKDKFIRDDLSTYKMLKQNKDLKKIEDDIKIDQYNEFLTHLNFSDNNTRIISSFNMVNGLDITTKYANNKTETPIAREAFPIKPIYMLLTPAQQNNTNKIIQYKINLYQYGNIDVTKIQTFIIYQMPKLVTATFTFNCAGYEIRKDTFGIFGNVRNTSSTAPANVNIITREEFDEGECRQFHSAYHCYNNKGTNTNLPKTETNGYENGMDSTTISSLDVNTNTPYKFGVRRFYNGTTTLESKYNQDVDNGIISYGTHRSIQSWPTYEYGELPILALNDQSEITIFLSTISSEKYTHNSSVSVSFGIKTEDNSVNTTISMSGNSSKFTNNNIYNASNNASNPLHWGENITGRDARAYPDETYSNTKRNNNANVMFSSYTGYRIYLKLWYSNHQTATKEISINGKRVKFTFIWANLGVVGYNGATGKFWHTGDCSK